MTMSALIPPSRKDAMGVLGAMVAIMLLYGQDPYPLSPAIIQFLVYTKLYAELVCFQEVGPQGDITSFVPFLSSYTTLDVATLKDRTGPFHESIAALILYQATIGLEPPMHPEIQAFIRGFRLQCRGATEMFDFAKAICCGFKGGSAGFLSQLSLSHISSYESIKDHVLIPRPCASVRNMISEAVGERFDFETFINGFLMGKGIPLPELWGDAVPHFNASLKVHLQNIEEPYFRPQIFFWATTGCPQLRADFQDGNVQIYFVDDEDTNYMDSHHNHPSHALRCVLLDEGKISLRTCSGAVRIPATYMKKLVEECKTKNEPYLPRLHHWLLCELLNRIGKHSMM
ncbi:hypothetical protein VKT23_017669 [Stygiomarasmius scandens]|uniref:Uncharacterized protein n=1 Tax=Marasmiellus scandens TaxID=2682957 RepID=A0ABR1IRE3_9AGAR